MWVRVVPIKLKPLDLDPSGNTSSRSNVAFGFSLLGVELVSTREI